MHEVDRVIAQRLTTSVPLVGQISHYIIASGGKTNETILATIQAGANAITYTPPSTQELFKTIMAGYRE